MRLTTCLIFLADSGLRPGGRVASFSSPSTPFVAYRRRQRRTVSTLLPTLRAISPALVPSPASITIRARHTTFCGVLRSSPVFPAAPPPPPLPIFWSNLNAFDLAHRARIAFLPGFGNHPMRTEH